PMSGQIVDASLVPAPKQRNTDGERKAIKAGKSADEIWPDKPAKAAQKDTDARWTLKIRQGAAPLIGLWSLLCLWLVAQALPLGQMFGGFEFANHHVHLLR